MLPSMDQFSIIDKDKGVFNVYGSVHRNNILVYKSN